MGHPSVYPTGTTLYDPEKAWNGYTVFQALETGAVLIDMNGNEVRRWEGLHGFPNKLLPGGYIMGHSGQRDPRYGMQDMVDIVQLDWEGNIVWSFNQHEFIQDPNLSPEWMARAHHDYQRSGNSVGYYAPNQIPQTQQGNTLILAHRNVYNYSISDKCLLDDIIIEVNWQGEIIWEWCCNQHFEELGFSDTAKSAIYNNPNMRSNGGSMGDWMHINSMSTLGPNPWFDQGDNRFHPDNIIWDARESNIIAIIDKSSGNIVWKLGPDYDTPELKHLGWIIGQHHAHMIPAGLPGAGNILIFDNGGWAGYGAPNPASSDGTKNVWRDYSRVLEINPITLDIVWRYSPYEADFPQPTDAFRFYSPYISNIQRLPNGNTLINEGADGRLFEVTPEHDIVWEFISPYWGKQFNTNMVYRAYRVPYDWVPQHSSPIEKAIQPPDNMTFRQPEAGPLQPTEVVHVKGVRPYTHSSETLCVASTPNSSRQSPPLFSVDKQRFSFLTSVSLSDLQTLHKNKILFVGAEHCIHCRTTYRQLSQLLTEDGFKNMPVLYLDADQNIETAEKLNIRTLPTILWLDENNLNKRLTGRQSFKDLSTWLLSLKK